MKELIEIIKNLTGEQIALISIFVTFLIYSLGRRNELRMKKHEAKKEQYIKFINFFQMTFDESKKKVSKSKLKESDFFDMGASLLLYGSKKLYKQYIFFREFTSNPLIQQCKFYDEKLAIYILSDIFITIRKEIGLNRFNNISTNESLAFFVNAIASNPETKVESYSASFKIKMIKLELFFIDIYRLVFIRQALYIFFMPALGVIKLIWKYLVMIPIGKLILRINPNASDKIKELEESFAQIKNN